MFKHKKFLVILVVLACLVSGFISGIYVGRLRGIPFLKIQKKWSIGIYIGESPLTFVSPKNIKNPVLTAKDVTDVPAEFVADPFMVKESNTFYIFFEVFNALTNQGDIGLATSNDGLNWTYRKIILDEPFHLSYPYVFKWNNEHYMITETHETYSIRLYKSIDFPTRWVFVKTLLSGVDYLDPTIFRYNDRWWIFTGSSHKRSNTLHLFYSYNLMGPWIEHPKSPIIKGDAHKARPGGRVSIYNGRMIRYAQDCYPTYGRQVIAFEIDLLTVTNYKEHEVSESPILKASGTGWNADGMHNIDPVQIDRDRWIACVDGYKTGLLLGWRY